MRLQWQGLWSEAGRSAGAFQRLERSHNKVILRELGVGNNEINIQMYLTVKAL